MRKTAIGGQALIEGLLMIGPKEYATAVRKPDGEIIIDKKPVKEKTLFFKIPLIRGTAGLIRQMIIGVKALMYSSEFVELEEKIDEKKPSKFEKFIYKYLGDKIKDIILYCSIAISLVFSIGVFVLLPNFLAGLLYFDKNISSGLFFYNFIEGLLRIILFIGYLILTSRLNDIKRVWQYHGAEHKTIHCYEHEEELTIENIKKYSIFHARCGTSFLFLVMVISILVFSFTGWHNILINSLIRIALVPVIAGLSYELLKLVEKKESKFFNIIKYPGLFFQRYTTAEPDDAQIEVAIAAISCVIDENEDIW